MARIRRVGVIGSGVMGSGIAAHMANAGLQVELLDIVPPNLPEDKKGDASARNQIPAEALKATLKSKPAAFYHKSRAALVRVGNLEDHFDRLAECDLIIEAIIERLDIKQQLFTRLENTIKPTTIVASNTSGLRIVDMTEGRSDSFKSRFLVMHFFNPVRYMKLLELVTGPRTSDVVLDTISKFGRDVLGKGIVVGKDTPNFVGNRIGAHSLMVTIHEMLAQGLKPEDVDAISGPPMAHPKTASFRTADLVGLDTFMHVVDNCYDVLTEDEDREVFKVPPFARNMVEKKLLGNKTGGGFYKKIKKPRDILVYDPTTEDYRQKDPTPEIKSAAKQISAVDDPRERVRQAVAAEGATGAFAWSVFSKSLAYSARRVGEITDRVDAIDDAMKWGYNWELGPFEVWDALGFKETVDRMKADGISLPESIDRMVASGAKGFYRDDEVFDLQAGDYVARNVDSRDASLEILRRGEAPVLSNGGAEAWDIGDGVLAVTFKTKANSLDDDVIAMLGEATERAEQDFDAMLLANEGEHFSVGANLLAVVMAANQQQWGEIEGVVQRLQTSLQRMKYSQIPVVAAPYGMALGGGLEVCLACDGVQAAAETYSGLVEVGVGLLPGGCGNLNLLWRALEGTPEGTKISLYEHVTQVFKNIAMANVATSAEEAKQFGYFRQADGISFDRARQLTEAKAKALGMARSGYHPPVPRAHKLPGEDGIATLKMMVQTLVDGGYATEHDALIAGKVATVLCGGPGGASREITEQEILDLEREAFVSLCGEQKSIERMQFMLMKNKPLRN